MAQIRMDYYSDNETVRFHTRPDRHQDSLILHLRLLSFFKPPSPSPGAGRGACAAGQGGGLGLQAVGEDGGGVRCAGGVAVGLASGAGQMGALHLRELAPQR